MKYTKMRHQLWLLSNFLYIALNYRYHQLEAFSTNTIVYTSPISPKYAGNGRRAMMTKQYGDDDNEKSPKIQFSSFITSIPTNASPVDVVLTWVTSDIGSIVLGGIGLILLLIGRLILDNDSADSMTPEAMSEQTRVNLLAVFAVGAVLLNGLSQLDVRSALAEKVELVGTVVAQPVIVNTKYGDNQQVPWVLSSILAATPADTVILLARSEGEEEEARWEPIAFVGVLPTNMMGSDRSVAKDTPIMDRMLRVSTTNTERRESYLPTLQALPGRIEFTNYLLPSNTQAALLLPIRLTSSQTATLLLGSKQARSFTPRDITWSQTVATRLELPLSKISLV